MSSLWRWSRVARESGLGPWQKDMKAEWLQFLKPDELRNLQKELKVLLQKGTGVNIHTTPLADIDVTLDAKYYPKAVPLTCPAPASPTDPAGPGPSNRPHPPSLFLLTISHQIATAELQVLQENFNCIFDVLRQPQSLHPKLSERMSLFPLPLHSFAQDVRQAKPNGTAHRNEPMMQPPTQCF
ncbi:hypothetical protein AURDEDRAFT_168616 [Auricularia subglabra TFB-10046 SS5]|nr:hypothetical protein AURDEDRAFT_168616 [Auricularia subglabra TFB-10046 SS5]